MNKPPIIGIDLGTTNSEVAFVHTTRPEILREGDDGILPSCVGVDGDGKLIVGATARNQAVAYPERTVLSVKRKMGKEQEIPLAGKSYTPQEISALILKELKEKAERIMGREVGHAVITVPAYFTDAQRQATKEAGAIAGLEVVRIINEPTAAALAYEGNNVGDEKRTILVYDLGGGTFDVSIVRIEDRVVEVLASTGDNRLGGDDFDDRIIQWLIRELKQKHHLDVTGNRTVLARLKSCAERAKIELSQAPTTRIEADHITEDIHLSVELTRETFEGMIREDIDKTMQSVTKALRDAAITPGGIDRILLVGGSSRIPMIYRMLKEKLKIDPNKEIDPDLCVALGAGIQAAREMGMDTSGVLIDITPYTFGTSAAEFNDEGLDPHVFVPLINRNTKLPVSHTETFYTMVDNQELALIQVFQGENKNALDNILIGSYRFDLSDNEAGSMITLKYDLDLNGILKLEAVEKETGRKLNAVIDNVFACEDPDRLRTSQAKINVFSSMGAAHSPGADTIPSDISDTLTLAREKLNVASKEDQDDIIDLMEEITDAVENKDFETARTICDELDDLLFYID
jgi:molecular chaperone DnaK (HSP70)